MSHHCHATACRTTVPPAMLMCGKHWRMVPRDIQRRVWATYRVGQCDDQSPSAEYCDAASAAVTAVALKEGVAPDVQLYDVFRRLARREGET